MMMDEKKSPGLENPGITQKNRQAHVNNQGEEHHIREGQMQRVPQRKRFCSQLQSHAAAFQKKFAGEQRQHAACR